LALGPPMSSLRAFALLALCTAAGCNAPEPPGSTGGTHQTGGECGRGLVVVSTDFQSTNVSLLGVDGAVLSRSFISSATSDAKLSAQLTGDVVSPTAPSDGSDVVLIDRYPASVLTWVDVETAHVSRQLSVRTGFDANPHDFLGLAPTKAYVTRYEANPAPGQTALDAGDDVLVIDPSVPSLTSSISLAPAMAGEDAKFHASPHRLVRAGDSVVALLVGESSSHGDAVASRLVRVDPETDEVGEVLVLDGLYECLSLALAPDGQRLALGCAGRFGGTSDPNPNEGGVVIVDTDGPLRELQRVPASALGASPGYGIDWVGDHTLALTTLGSFGGAGAPARADRVVELALDPVEVRELLTSASEPFTLSDVRSAARCGACFVTDAERGRVFRFPLGADGHLGQPEAITVDDTIGLPPRWLGQF